MFFYPTITDELKESAGYNSSNYSFSYLLDGVEKKLSAKGKNSIKLEDPLETWNVENDGIRIHRTISFEYPEMLYGENGIASRNAELGLCIKWINHSLTQMGTILPINMYADGAIKFYEFDYRFEPGTIKGDLSLSLQIYLKKSAESVLENEGHLLNEEGVTAGTLDDIRLDFDNSYMEFPIQEISNKSQPLWWLEIGDWTDPTTDLFNEENVRIYLNTAYESCPKFGEEIKHEDVLVDILATAYTMLFNKVAEMEYLKQTIDNTDLEPGSISKILFYFKDSCNTDLDFSSTERLHKSIWMNVAAMLSGGEES